MQVLASATVAKTGFPGGWSWGREDGAERFKDVLLREGLR